MEGCGGDVRVIHLGVGGGEGVVSAEVCRYVLQLFFLGSSGGCGGGGDGGWCPEGCQGAKERASNGH